jgi:signal transduction histidine kinase
MLNGDAEKQKTSMSTDENSIAVETVLLSTLAEALSHTHPFAGTSFDAISAALKGDEPATEPTVDRLQAPAGAVIVEPDQPLGYYYIVLDGDVQAERIERDGSRTLVGTTTVGEGFGEAAILTGKSKAGIVISARRDSVILRFPADTFWKLMACCPALRTTVLADVAKRLQSYQVEALHREKLVALGTLAAGLMHELHNPGSAAKRAASQLRQNLLRLQQLSLRFSDEPKTRVQTDCMRSLLEQTLKSCSVPAMSSLDQMDAEESIAQFLQSAGVENAYRIAPSLIAVGLRQPEIECAKEAFPPQGFSDALNWLEALVSSVSLVCTIEEGITRVSELVVAVKKFAYDDRSSGKPLDVHDSLQSTLTILGHKIRLKGVTAQKNFRADPSTIQTRGTLLSQVWTNLIDNAVDASPDAGSIEIDTWNEPGSNGPGQLGVSITDHGPGIPPDVLPHIFEPFFTTKPQGSGTGLGLEIVHRIVSQKFEGTINVDSEPGRTSFIVRLPLETPTPPEAPR